jgi:hypothetical protein
MWLLDLPECLTEIAHFWVPRVKTWGGLGDAQFREEVRRAAALPAGAGRNCDGFICCIWCVVGESRGKWARNVPDVENMPILVVDTFTGTLYFDDNLNHVRAVQVEAVRGPDDHEALEGYISAALRVLA